jgi:hypothetical protein
MRFTASKDQTAATFGCMMLAANGRELGGLIFWQNPQDHPLNLKKRKEQSAPEEPSAFREPLSLPHIWQ